MSVTTKCVVYIVEISTYMQNIRLTATLIPFNITYVDLKIPWIVKFMMQKLPSKF